MIWNRLEIVRLFPVGHGKPGHSEILKTDIELRVYLPPGYDDSDDSFPVAYVVGAKEALELGQMAAAIDNSSAPNTILVFLPPARGKGFSDSIATEIVPFVDKEFRTRADRESRMIVGFGFTAGGALVTGAINNEVFANVGGQSPLAFAAEEKMILDAFSSVKMPTNVHLQWGRYDMFNPHENWDLRESGEKLFTEIGKNENVTIAGGMVNDSTDWSSWKNRYHEILGLLNQ